MHKIFAERKEKGAFGVIVKKAQPLDEDFFFFMFQMSPTKFEELLNMLAVTFIKQ